ncbi:hypothetical protein [Massilia sp. CF038]|uniref:hypothetical protein n=1 Tax=Massilia sp. CF038 TaxID=1881045 RepID=UPI0009191AA0|nr:hypothetical protein [Massilia sp. CF038]SHH18823.1 hypothetical protein SAMN05428948_3220 [Massilia sp. CF038]
MNPSSSISCAALLVLLGAPPAALAQPALGPAVPSAMLAHTRGGSADLHASSSLTAAVNNNSANQVVTGANTVQGGAFRGAAGIPVVIQNTGANVSIQNATVVQLQLR